MSAAVQMYSSRYCPFCMRAKMLLQQKQVTFDEILVDGQPELRAKMRELTGRNTVPQIFIAGQPIGGCDDLFALERAGKLDPLLAG